MSALCHVLEVSSVEEEEEDVRRGRRTNLGMDDMAQIGRWSLAMVGRRRLLTPLLYEKANS